MLLKEIFYKKKNEKAWSLWLLPLLFLPCFIFSAQSFAITIEENSVTATVSESDRQDYSEVVKELKDLIEKGDSEVLRWIARDILSLPHWNKHPELVEALIEKGDQGVLKEIAIYVLSKPHWNKQPELVEALIEKGDQGVLKEITRYVLSQPHWNKHPELVKAIIAKGEQEVLDLAVYLLPKVHWNNPELVKALIAKGKGDSRFFKYVVKFLSKPHWKDHPDLVKAIIAKGDSEVLESVAKILSKPYWQLRPDYPELLKALIERKKELEKLK